LLIYVFDNMCKALLVKVKKKAKVNAPFESARTALLKGL